MFKTSLLRSDTQLNQLSYYEASVLRPPPLAPLQGDQVADVLVVPLVAKGGRMSFGPLPLGPAFVMGE